MVNLGNFRFALGSAPVLGPCAYTWIVAYLGQSRFTFSSPVLITQLGGSSVKVTKTCTSVTLKELWAKNLSSKKLLPLPPTCDTVDEAKLFLYSPTRSKISVELSETHLDKTRLNR